MLPDHIFIVYGSLAPGKANHSFIQHIEGDWKRGRVFGKLKKKGWGADMGFPGFVRSDNPSPIDAHILFSDKLPLYWSKIDDFEGQEYKRELVEFELEDGQQGSGYLYVLRSDS